MSDETDLRIAMDELVRAHREGDTETIERLTAAEYAQTDIWGRRQDRAAWLAEYFRPLAALIGTGRFRWEVYDQRDVDVRLLGDAAVVTGTLELRGRGARPRWRSWEADPDARIGATLRFTRFWIRRDGAWRIAALHNAVAPPQEASGPPPRAAANAETPGSASSPKVLLRRFCEEVWTKGNVDVADEIVAASLLVHDPRSGDVRRSAEDEKRTARVWHDAFPDLSFVLDFVLEEGDKAVVQWTMAGTHTGALGDVPPTHKRFEIKGANVWRFEGGRAVEIWNHRNDLAFLRQLGLGGWPGAKP
jgi:steroid delta-isomerase-like uncharacterized protein